MNETDNGSNQSVNDYLNKQDKDKQIRKRVEDKFRKEQTAKGGTLNLKEGEYISPNGTIKSKVNNYQEFDPSASPIQTSTKK